MNHEIETRADPAVTAADEREELAGIVQRCLRQAARLGADQAEVDAESHRGLSVTVRLGEVETVEHSRDRGLSVTVYGGHCKGSASSADLGADSVRDAVEKAATIARYTQEDRANGLADAALMAETWPDLDLWHPRQISVDEAIERALAVESAGRELDPRIANSEGATFGVEFAARAYGNSHGFIGTEHATNFHQDVALVASQGGRMQRDYWWDSRRRWQTLESAGATGRRAAERTLARLGARSVPTARVPVLFAPEMARGLIGHLVSAVSGGALYRGASFLLDHAGQRIFPAGVDIVEHPHLARGPASAGFDGDGVATRDPGPLVSDGVLERYVLGSYSARRLGLETTANAGGVRNLRVAPGSRDQQALIAGLERGLVVTELMGQGVNTVTGDYSRGASGFWVENGEIQHPVEEVTIAGNLKDMFADIEALGSDLDTRASLQVPSLLVGRMTVAGS